MRICDLKLKIFSVCDVTKFSFHQFHFFLSLSSLCYCMYNIAKLVKTISTYACMKCKSFNKLTAMFLNIHAFDRYDKELKPWSCKQYDP